MFNEALSEQSCVCEGAGYDEVYPSGQGNPDSSYLERDSSTNSPSEEEDEDSNEDRSESYIDGVSDDEESDESPIRAVIGPDGLRNFILPLIWMVNDFSLTIQRKHFSTLWDRYQIPIDVPIRLPK